MEEKERSLLIPLVAGAIVLLVVLGAAWLFFFRSSSAHVSGQVTLDSKPVPHANVVFIGEDAKNETPIATQSDSSGYYRLVGNVEAGIPVGKYKVAVTQMALKDGTVPQGEMLEQARAKGLLSNSLPGVYEDRKTTPLQYDIRSGGNTINLELKKPLGPK